MNFIDRYKEDNMAKRKYMMYDWDSCKYIKIPTNDIVKAIYYAWNYEFDTYDIKTGNVILSRMDDNELNCELLKPYGLRLIDHKRFRQLQSIDTGEIFKASWENN